LLQNVKIQILATVPHTDKLWKQAAAADVVRDSKDLISIMKGNEEQGGLGNKHIPVSKVSVLGPVLLLSVRLDGLICWCRIESLISHLLIALPSAIKKSSSEVLIPARSIIHVATNSELITSMCFEILEIMLTSHLGHNRWLGERERERENNE
jgi:hypothetical protein